MGTQLTARQLMPISANIPRPTFCLTHLEEGIGIALDFKGNRMFLTDLAGSIYSAKLDGTEKKPLLAAQGQLTGIAYAEIPKAVEALNR